MRLLARKITRQTEKSAKTTHSGTTPLRLDIEMKVHDWILVQREAEGSVSTVSIICKALTLDSSFKDGLLNRIRH